MRTNPVRFGVLAILLAIGWAGVGALTGAVMGATSLAITAALFLNAGSQTAIESRANFIVWVFIATLALLAMLATGAGNGKIYLWQAG